MQSSPVSKVSFVKVSFKVLLILSTCPELWCLHAQYSFQSVLSAVAIPWLTLEMKAFPLSDASNAGNPYLASHVFKKFLCCLLFYWKGLWPTGDGVYEH